MSSPFAIFEVNNTKGYFINLSVDEDDNIKGEILIKKGSPIRKAWKKQQSFPDMLRFLADWIEKTKEDPQ
jgi:hypothetical protein